MVSDKMCKKDKRRMLFYFLSDLDETSYYFKQLRKQCRSVVSVISLIPLKSLPLHMTRYEDGSLFSNMIQWRMKEAV
jgi:hypothetical protein